MSKINDEENDYKKQKQKHLEDMRKKKEQETGEKFEAKYKMYIVPHRGFVSDLEEPWRRMSGRRYCFHIDRYEKAIDLNIDEVINCIADCGNSYCNWQYKVIPEDEFLKEWEDYKKTHMEKLKEPSRHYGFECRKLNIDDILHQKKNIKMRKMGMLMRQYYYDVGIFGNPYNITTYYSLITDSERHTSAIVDYKISDEGIEFETMNSIYIIKEFKKLDYIDQLKEFDDYKKSSYYKEFFDAIKKQELTVMNNLMEGKDYDFIAP